MLNKWENDHPVTSGVKDNGDGTFTGYFYKGDGSTPRTKIYQSKDDYYENLDNDRVELFKE